MRLSSLLDIFRGKYFYSIYLPDTKSEILRYLKTIELKHSEFRFKKKKKKKKKLFKLFIQF